MVATKDPYLSAIMKRYLLHNSIYMQNQNDTANDYSIEQIADKLLESLTEQHLFVLYMAFHTYFYMSAQNNADIVIDTTKVAKDENYRDRVCRQLTCATGLPITFDDVSEIQRYHPFDPVLIDWKEIKENLELAVLTLDHLFDRQELLRYGMELVDETRAEIEISERYVATARHEMTTLTSQLDSVTAATARLAEQRDWLADERDTLLAERDRLAAERDRLAAERDRLAAELALGNVDGVKLSAENLRLSSEVALAIAAGIQQASAIAVLRGETAELRNEFSLMEADRDRIVAQSERWFNAAVVWPSGGTSTRRLPPAQWFQRLKLRLCAGLTGRWIRRVNPRASTRIRANGARDVCQWEFAARCYADDLTRNSWDPAIWIQFGHALKEARRLSESETAYRTAVILDEAAIDALLSLGHVLTLQQKRAEAARIYTQTLDLEIPAPLRSAIVKELELLYSPTEAIPARGEWVCFSS